MGMMGYTQAVEDRVHASGAYMSPCLFPNVRLRPDTVVGLAAGGQGCLRSPVVLPAPPGLRAESFVFRRIPNRARAPFSYFRPAPYPSYATAGQAGGAPPPGPQAPPMEQQQQQQQTQGPQPNEHEQQEPGPPPQQQQQQQQQAPAPPPPHPPQQQHQQAPMAPQPQQQHMHQPQPAPSPPQQPPPPPQQQQQRAGPSSGQGMEGLNGTSKRREVFLQPGMWVLHQERNMVLPRYGLVVAMVYSDNQHRWMARVVYGDGRQADLNSARDCRVVTANAVDADIRQQVGAAIASLSASLFPDECQMMSDWELCGVTFPPGMHPPAPAPAPQRAAKTARQAPAPAPQGTAEGTRRKSRSHAAAGTHTRVPKQRRRSEKHTTPMQQGEVTSESEIYGDDASLSGDSYDQHAATDGREFRSPSPQPGPRMGPTISADPAPASSKATGPRRGHRPG